MRLIYLTTFVLLTFAGLNVNAQTNPNFYLHENGVTVMCPDAEVGETGAVDGVIYEKIDAINDLKVHGGNVSADRACTSGISSMNSAFIFIDLGDDQFANFNKDISHWDVSSVTNMYRMFRYTLSFNQDIGSWDVSNVSDMSEMFIGAESFNQDIGAWNVSNVTDMSQMFSSAERFNQDIGSWDVGNVTDMSYMFSRAERFNQNIGSWDVSNVTDMRWMFFGTDAFDQDIGSWNVSNVINMSYMFSSTSFISGVTPFNQDIGSWDVSNVTNMSDMFTGAEHFNQDIGSWDVSNVTDMTRMFRRAKIFNQDIGNWNVSSVTNMEDMFNKAETFNQDLSNWCVDRVSERSGFATDAALNEEFYPKWGTCPGRPSNIELQIPIDNAEDIPLTPSFNWEEATDATNYQLQVFDDSDQIFVDTVVNDVSFELTDSLQSVQTYHWKVRGINDDESIIGNWSATRSFTTILIPPPNVILLTPTNSSSDISLLPTFDWKKSHRTDEYLIQISEDDNFNTIFIDSILTQPDFKISKSLEPDVTYYWRTKAINEAGEGPWSETWSFTTISGSSSLLFPENGSEVNSLRPKIIWSQTSNAVKYRFELSSSKNFAFSIIDSSVTDTSFTPLEKLHNNRKKYWRVKVILENGESAWSEIWSFTPFVEEPQSSSLLFPENGSEVNTLRPEIIWSRTPRADTYRFELTDTQTFAYSIIDSSVTDTTFLPSAKLENGTKYYWRVKASGDGGESEWSETFTFYIPFSVSIEHEGVPDKFSLSQNYPNPFNPSTQVNYALPQASYVKLKVINTLGQQVATLVDERKSAGNYSITFNASGLSSGFYFYSIEAGDFRQTKKMLLIK